MYGAEFNPSSSLLLLHSSRRNLAIAAADVNGAPREPVDVDGWLLSVDVVVALKPDSADWLRGNHEGGSVVSMTGGEDGSLLSSELDDTTMARGIPFTQAMGFAHEVFLSPNFCFLAVVSKKIDIASSTSWSSWPQSAEIEISFVVFKL